MSEGVELFSTSPRTSDTEDGPMFLEPNSTYKAIYTSFPETK